MVSRFSEYRFRYDAGKTLLIALLLLVSFGMRILGIDWDQGVMYHPDERAIFMKAWDLSFPVDNLGLLFNADQSPWNPRWFPYGSYLLYQLKIASEVMSVGEFGDLRFIGRGLAALADTFTVFVVVMIGQRFFNFATALVAGMLTAFCVLHIQLSHFYTAEPFFTLFVLCCLWFAYKVAESGRTRDGAVAGIFFGLAMGTKVSAAPVIGAFAVACMLNVMQASQWEDFSFQKARVGLFRALQLMATFLVSGFVVFVIVCPYALLDFSTFLMDITEQRQMVTRSVDLPYTRQYEETTRYLYQVVQLSRWGLGIPLASMVFVGLTYSCWRLYKRLNNGLVILLAWLTLYTVVTGWFDVKFLRYMLPVVPVMIIVGTYGVISLAENMKSTANTVSRVILGMVIGVTILTAGYAVAYLQIYTEPHVATRASAWINNNVPVNSLLLSEHWEESIPGIEQYPQQKLPMYEVDDEKKLNELSFMASTADYIIFYSDRLYGTVGRLEQRYPISGGFYRTLFSGELGYILAHAEHAYPNLLGVSIVNDTFGRPSLPVPDGATNITGTLEIKLGYSDESFTVYDHPLILIFANEKRLSKTDIEEAIVADSIWLRPDGILQDSYHIYSQNQPAEFSDEQKGVYQQAGTWSSLVMEANRSLALQVVLWVGLVIMIHLAVLPLCVSIFSALPDRGYLLGKTFGILITCFLVWLFASLGVMEFTSWFFWVILGIVGVSIWVWAGTKNRVFKEMLQLHWKQWGLGEVIFLGAFFAFLVIRMMNPDLWHPWRGGEKFMELAYLSATFKSAFMPPYDPWFAGGYLNYYYFGYFFIACLAKAVFISPSLAFNLAIPLIFALIVSNSYSLGYNLAAIGDQNWHEDLHKIRKRYVSSGIFTALLVAVLANLDGVIQLYEKFRYRFFEGGGWSGFDYWRSSRLMPPDPPGHEITEFPYWSLLFGDLHAHVMSIPFGLLVLGLLLTIFVRGISLSFKSLAIYGFLALSCGALWPLNAWDFPTYVALIIGVLGFVSIRDHRLEKSGLIRSSIIAIGVTSFSVILYLPFHQAYKGYGLGLVISKTQTDAIQYLMIHGLFVFILVSFVIWMYGNGFKVLLGRGLGFSTGTQFSGLHIRKYLHWGRDYITHQEDTTVVQNTLVQEQSNRYAELPLDTSVRRWLIWFIVVSAIGILSLFALSGYLVVVVLSVVAGSIVWMVVRGALCGYTGRADSFALLVVVMALMLGVAVDVVTFNNDIGRMNTVFKFYEQAWVLWGIGCGYLLYLLISRWLMPFSVNRYKFIWVFSLVGLIISASVFPILGTQARLNDRFQTLPMTLDGMAYMETSTYSDPNGPIELKNDLRAIEWMRENVQGSPVILEGRAPLYRWGGRISVYTGLPSIVGWDWHQTQQRMAFGQEVNNRSQVVDLIYNTENENHAIDLIDYYDVRYVVLGELEHLYYNKSGLRKFDNMIGNGLDLAYQYPEVNPKVKIYSRVP